MDLPKFNVTVNLGGRLRSEHGYSLVSFLAIAAATIVGFQVVRSEGLGLSGLTVLNFDLLIDAVTLLYAEARLKEKKKSKSARRSKLEKC